MKVYKFAYSASVAALLAAIPSLALAQAAPDEGAVVEEVVVTGSRIQGGFQQPTPVTVVGVEDLQKAMPSTVANYLNQLPSFGAPVGSATPSSGVAGAGLSLLNLRSLGSSRTLVLLDNRRVVNSNTSGGVDTNTLPTTLVKRIEVVTGGASAAWGADAVAGVVNFVLDTDYRGLEVAVQAGQTERSDNRNRKVDVTFGREFLDGRASIIGAVTLSDSPDQVRLGSREDDWWQPLRVVENRLNCTFSGAVFVSCPSGQTRYITALTGLLNNAPGTVVTNIAANGVLRGTQFVGTGIPAPYDYGYTSTTTQVGGTLTLNTARSRNLTNALTYGTGFLHGEYQLTDNVTAFAEFSYGKSRVISDSIFYLRSNFVVRNDNAYLPAATRAIMAANGLTTFTASRVNTEAPGAPGGKNYRVMMRELVGLEGTSGDWTWSAYAEAGQVQVDNNARYTTILDRYNAAIDPIRTSTGEIACRTTTPTALRPVGYSGPAYNAAAAALVPGCVPYNIFGVGNASKEAIDWVTGTNQEQRIKLNHEFVSAEVSGPIFDVPAGQVTIAFGMDYSKEKAVATSDPISQARGFSTGNPQPFDGMVSFKEMFFEANVPIIKDLPLLQLLEFNAAGRTTEYSTSGTVNTWKLGISNQVTDELRVRATRSRDIRAPTLLDLFNRGSQGTQTVFDPLKGTSQVIPNITSGNPDLEPEEADTTTAGVVYRPGWLPGLQLSVDYYDITVNGAIATLSPFQTADLCFSTRPDLCVNLIRDANLNLIGTRLKPTNIAQFKTSGVDVEVVYRRPVFDGAMTVRALAAYQPEITEIDALGNVDEYGGSVGGVNEGQPDWKAQLSVGYAAETYSLTAVYRYIGETVLRNEWVQGVDVDVNNIDATGYLDLRGTYDFTVGNIETSLSLSINNVFDTPPRINPDTPTTGGYGASGASTRYDIYDALGRSFSVGLRAKF